MRAPLVAFALLVTGCFRTSDLREAHRQRVVEINNQTECRSSGYGHVKCETTKR